MPAAGKLLIVFGLSPHCQLPFICQQLFKTIIEDTNMHANLLSAVGPEIPIHHEGLRSVAGTISFLSVPRRRL